MTSCNFWEWGWWMRWAGVDGDGGEREEAGAGLPPEKVHFVNLAFKGRELILIV